MILVRTGAGLVLVAALSAACATTQARVAVEPPQPLVVPAAPPRIIVPTDPTPPPPEEARAPVTPARPRPNRPAPRPDPRVEPPKPAEVVDVTKPPNGQEAPATPAPTLEMQPGDRGDAVVRQQLGKAGEDLLRVNYSGLSAGLKAQYDTAKRFITLGEQALKEQNLIFAATLAEKAGAIATLLLRR